MKWRMLDTT